MDTINNLVTRYLSPVIAAVIGWFGSLGVPLPEDTHATILTALAVLIAALVLPVVDFVKNKLVGLFAKGPELD